MKISTEIPEIYKECHRVFNVNWDDGLAITFGETIHAKYPLRPDVIAHEKVHIEQQKLTGPLKWWNLYLSDNDFRFKQEIEAYRAQVVFLKKTIKDKNLLFKMINNLAHDLSGPMYGNICFLSDAIKLISSN